MTGNDDWDDSQFSDRSSRRFMVRRYVLAPVIFVVGGAVILSLWQIVARPELSWLASLTLWSGAFVSTGIRDLPYAWAPLDPDSLLIETLLMVTLGLFPVAGIAAVAGFRREGPVNAGSAVIGLRGAGQLVNRARARGRTNWVLWATILVCAAVCTVGVLAASVVGHAVRIRSVHLANMAILAPKLPDEEIENLNAEFASMTTQAQYVALRQHTDERGADVGVVLRPTP